MPRCAFVLKVKQDKIEEYRQHHEHVWPEMLDALRATGWHNYSLFLRDDGLLIGYVETPDFQRAVAGMQEEPVNHRWQATVKHLFEQLETAAADTSMRPIPEVFHLD